MQSQTTFETTRGISSIDISQGHALIIVSNISENENGKQKISALKAIKQSGISMDFLKLSADGFSFIVPEEAAQSAKDALCKHNFNVTLLKDRAILSVYAPNIRDESGLVARIAQRVVQTGAYIDSLGDMHSQVLIVLDSKFAQQAKNSLESLIGKVEAI